MKVLIVDDDRDVLQAVAMSMDDPQWEVDTELKPVAALEKISEYDALITDVRMPEMDGIQLLQAARRLNPAIEVLVLTAYATVSNAVEAIQSGARAYVMKPPDMDELRGHLKEIQRIVHLREGARRIRRGGLVGASPAMQEVYRQIDECACSMAAVLITGETGTGKELAAKAIHEASGRRQEPFVSMNVANVPSQLAESELFGHRKGAFTGANQDYPGKFKLASGGTLFLDEVNSLPIDLQGKLLRAVEQKEIWSLGAVEAENIDVRIVAATNQPLADLVKAGEFREDLFYRLNVLSVDMPPLRDHREDLPVIARELLGQISDRYEDRELILEDSDLQILNDQHWPGNVRELGSVLERAVARAMAAADDDQRKIVLGFPGLGGTAVKATAEDIGGLSFKDAKAKAVAEWTVGVIRAALERNGGNVSQTARELQMSRTALIRLIQKLEIR